MLMVFFCIVCNPSNGPVPDNNWLYFRTDSMQLAVVLLNDALINQCFGATGLQRLLIYVCLHLGPGEDEFSFCWHSCLRVCSSQLGLEQMSSSCTQCYRSFSYYAVSCCLAVSCDAKYTHTKNLCGPSNTASKSQINRRKTRLASDCVED